MTEESKKEEEEHEEEEDERLSSYVPYVTYVRGVRLPSVGDRGYLNGVHACGGGMRGSD